MRNTLSLALCVGVGAACFSGCTNDGQGDRRIQQSPDVEKVTALVESLKTKHAVMSKSDTEQNLREVLNWSSDHHTTEEENRSGKASLFYKLLSLKAEGQTGRRFVDNLSQRLNASADFSLSYAEYGLFYTETIDPQVLEVLLRIGFANAQPGVYLEVGQELPESVTFKLFFIPQKRNDPEPHVASLAIENGTIVGADQLLGVPIPAGRPLTFNATRQKGRDLLLNVKSSDNSFVAFTLRGTPLKSEREVTLEYELEGTKQRLIETAQQLAESNRERDSYKNAKYIMTIYSWPNQDPNHKKATIQLGRMGPNGFGIPDTAPVSADGDSGWYFSHDDGPHCIWVTRQLGN